MHAQRRTFEGPNRTGTTQVNLLGTLGCRMLRVARVEDVAPRYRRVVLTGEDLAPESASGAFPWVHLAVTDHVKLFFPNPETGEHVVPVLAERGWTTEGTGEPIYRDYTVRAYDKAARELTIDFVVHDHGVAGRWAGGAEPGDALGVLGPRGNVLFPEDIEHYVAVGDETAIPAISRLIEEAPAGSRVTAIIEIADPREQQHLEGRAALDLRWVPRDPALVGAGHASALETAVRELEPPIDPGERVFAFAAGEATIMKPIRRYLRRDLGLPRERVDVDGYWKRGVTNLDHHRNDLTEDDE